MKRIVVKYSEDFRKSKVVHQIYGILRDKGFDPLVVKDNYLVSLGEGEVAYTFRDGVNLPKESELEKMFMGMKFNSVDIFEDKETLQGTGASSII